MKINSIRRRMKSDAMSPYRNTFLVIGLSFSLFLFVFAIFFWNSLEFFGLDVSTDNFMLTRTTLIQLSGTAGIFGIFHAYVTRTDFEYEVTRALTTLLGNDPSNFDHFHMRVKRQFVENSIISALRPTLGKAVFESIVEPYFTESNRRRKNYRKNMVYGVDFFEPSQEDLDTWADFFDLSRKHFLDNYFFVSHYIKYTKIPAYPIDTVKIAIGFNERTMQNFLRRDDVFYRDLIRLDDDLIAKLQVACKDEKSLEYFVRKVLRFDIQGQGFSWDDVEMKFQFLSDDNVPHLEIDVKCHNKHDPEFSVKHISIQSKTANMFLMTVPEPCDSPTLWLGAKKGMMDVLPRPLFSTVNPSAIHIESKEESVGEDGYSVERHYVRVNGWSFPLGGVIFVWRT